MEVIILASGSKANSMLVKTGDALIMIDCGLNARVAFRRIIDAGFRLEHVTGVFISHQHFDHTSGLSKIIEALPKLPVYMSCECFLAMNFDDFKFVPNVNVIQPGEPFDIQGVSVEAFEVPHDVYCLGYRITHGDDSFAMATDVGHISGSVERGLRGAKTIAIESSFDPDVLAVNEYAAILRKRIEGPYGHLSNEQCCAFLRGDLTGTELVILLHLSESANTSSLARLMAEDAIGGRAELVIAGKDGGLT